MHQLIKKEKVDLKFGKLLNQSHFFNFLLAAEEGWAAVDGRLLPANKFFLG